MLSDRLSSTVRERTSHSLPLDLANVGGPNQWSTGATITLVTCATAVEASRGKSTLGITATLSQQLVLTFVIACINRLCLLGPLQNDVPDTYLLHEQI